MLCFTACPVIAILTAEIHAIVGGGHVASNPFVASILQNGEFVCAGTPINTRHFLTTANCALKLRPERNLFARAGSPQYTGGQRFDIQKIRVYPDYQNDPVNEDNYRQPLPGHDDIAILDLATSAQNVKPVTLPLLPLSRPSDGSNVSIYGWGLTSFGSAAGPTRSLLSTSYTVLGRHKCLQQQTLGTTGAAEFCANAVAGGKGVCYYDQGGPVMQGNAIVGIIHTVRCGMFAAADIHTNVGDYRPWILEQELL